jgi:hypothetical protein
MKINHLHIIALTVPYPVNYGGVFDLFYKLKALHKAGIRIHLHCFDYGRGEQPELNKYCASVHYYKRSIAFRHLFSRLPYIVVSRKNADLLHNLLQDEYPILMEGTHCTFPLMDARFARRACFVRLCNIESDYYKDLARNSSFLKKLYFNREAFLLRQYEKTIAGKAAFLTLTRKDATNFGSRFGAKQVAYIPAFLPEWKVAPPQGTGTCCLFHADLSVTLNEKAAVWILDQLAEHIRIPLCIAGKNPSPELTEYVKAFPGVQLVANPSDEAMQQLIRDAHVHLLPALSNTGIKLKLLNVLYNGRHIVANHAMIEGTGFDKAVHLADSREEWLKVIEQLLSQPFTQAEIALRKTLLDREYDSEKNALAMADFIFNKAGKEKR